MTNEVFATNYSELVPESISRIRADIRRWLADQGFEEGYVQSKIMPIGEVLTNLIRHGHDRECKVELSVLADGFTFALTARSHNEKFTPIHDRLEEIKAGRSCSFSSRGGGGLYVFLAESKKVDLDRQSGRLVAVF